jgi:flagellar biosynthesis protein FlhF
MEVRTYEALTVKDAIDNVKRDLGNNAVILSVKNQNTPGQDQQKAVEVRAAAMSKSSSQNGSLGSDIIEATSEVHQNIKIVDARVKSLGESLAKREHIESVEFALKEMRVLLVDSLRNFEAGLIPDLPLFLRAIEEQLKISGVQPKIIIDLLKAISLQEHPATLTDSEELTDYYRGLAIKWLLKRIHIAPRWTFEPGSPSFHAFIGGCGVGKTSALAKIATHYISKESTPIHIISMDHNRIAASEQLRVYAKVVGAPFSEIENINDLKEIVRKNNDRAAFLIDTGGIGLRQSSQLAGLKALTEDTIPINFHLTLSCTEKTELLERQIAMFSPLGIRSLLFTKIDESTSFGDVLNQSIRWSVPLSYFSTGTNVPDDIERASRERVVERVLGL